jgi:hypothetical protein
MIVEKLKL